MAESDYRREPRGEITVLRRLGKGGMATVHEALVAGRRVALKRPRRDVLERRPEVRDRFEREYHTLAQLGHPNIIDVYAYGIDAEGPFYTMELLEAGDLSELIPMPWPTACRVLRDVAAALAMVHSRRLVHRDVSLHNVRLTSDGTAKLIDFGAMTPIGVAAEAMGTPPYMAPEAVYHQALDQRTDLYALGALGYRLLSGQEAYPARRIDQMRDVWRSRPRPLSEKIADIPPQLDELIRQLLSLNPAGRCRTAAEVIVRLSSIAGLENSADAEIARSYLTLPGLVGRELELSAIRQHIMQGVRSGGSTLTIEGAAGMGRSRLLDACILDGELLGASVLRARAVAGSNNSFSLLAALGSELAKARPNSPPSSPAIRGLLERGHADAPAPNANAAEQQLALQRELVAWFLDANEKSLILIVDDMHLADLESAAVLTRLVDVAPQHHLTIIASILIGGQTVCAHALRLIRERATTLTLPPLSEEQTLALVGSLFDDVVNVRLAAKRIYEIARGSPQATVDLAEWLVEGGHVQHEAGSWHIPDTLSGLPLPESVDDALRQRLSALGPNAIKLGTAIAIAGDADLSAGDYAALLEETDDRAAQQALVELLGANVVVPHGHGRGYGLAQTAYHMLLIERLDPSVIAMLHRRIARVCLERQQLDWAIYHLFYGQAESQAVDLFQQRVAQGHSPSNILYSLEERVGWLREVLAYCQQQQRSAAEIFALKNELVRRAEIKASLVRREIEELSAHYKDLTGYFDWQSLPASMDPVARVTAALQAAAQRHQSRPAHERIMEPAQALPSMVEFISACLASATANTEISLLEQLPSLVPFAPLSDSIRLLARYIEASEATIVGRADVASATFIEVLNELDGDTGVKLGATADRLRRHSMIAIGMLNAGLSRSIALDYADRLAALAAKTRDAYAKSTSLRIRHQYHLRRGNWRQAQHWQREVELDKLTDRSAVFNPSGIYALSWIHATVGNVAGMRECLTQMHEYSAVSEGLRVWERYMAAEYDRLRGAGEQALAQYAPILEHTAGRHMAWLYAAHGALLCYETVGQLEEGKRVGERLLQQARAARLDAARGLILRPLALIEARLGHFGQALAYLEENIERSKRHGMGGINLGVAYEFRARVAIWAHDKPAFERYAGWCAECYAAGGGSPELTARLDALLSDARRRGVVEASWQSPDVSALSLSHSQVELRDRLADSSAADDRFMRALIAIVKSANAAGGHLYGLTGDGIKLLAHTDDELPSPELLETAARCLHTALDSRNATQDSALDTMFTQSQVTAAATKPGRRGGRAMPEFTPFVLFEPSARHVVGMFLLRAKNTQTHAPEDELMDVVAAALVAAHDVCAA